MPGKVPIWFWRLKAAPYGARLPKRTIRAPKKWSKEDKVLPILNARVGRQLAARNVRARKPGSLAGFEGNLKAEQYQYFYGLKGSVNSAAYSWGMCRICRRTFTNEADRMKHLKRKAGERLSCAMKAIIVCNLLMRDGACVICDTRTEDRKWGLPLCDREACLTTFMFSEHGKNPFKEAIEVAEKSNWPRSKRK